MNGVPATPWSKDAFEAKYHRETDPWKFATSSYELARYGKTVGALQRRHYSSAFEPGCSIGVLTTKLAQRCSRVLAWDIAPAAVTEARRRCKKFSGVKIQCKDLSVESLPKGPFDLIIFSEIGYYFSSTFLSVLANKFHCSLRPGGEFVAVHWLGNSSDHQLHGSKVHAILKAQLQLTWVKGEAHPMYVIDTWIL